MTLLSGNRTIVAMASCTLLNTGHKYTGTEVVQLYVEDPVMQYVRPWKRLIAFTRVTVAPGKSTVVTIPVTADELAFYDDDMVLRVRSLSQFVSFSVDPCPELLRERDRRRFIEPSVHSVLGFTCRLFRESTRSRSGPTRSTTITLLWSKFLSEEDDKSRPPPPPSPSAYCGRGSGCNFCSMFEKCR